MAKKPTMKEAKQQIDALTKHVNFMSRMMDSIGVAFTNYIKFKGDEENFKEYLENNKNLHKLTQEEQNDRKEGHSKEVDNVPAEKVRKKENEAE